MTDIFDTQQRSAIMGKIRSKGTRPEIIVAHILKRAGWQSTMHDARLPGCPDFVLKKHRVVIQVKGCFWHVHCCQSGRRPKSNSQYWAAKLERNRKRDQRNERALRKEGWHVLTVWECHLDRRNFESAFIRKMKKYAI